MTSTDQALTEIQSTMQQLYASLCFRKGEKPDMDKIKSFFLPKAMLVNNNSAQPTVMTIEDFLGWYQGQVEQGMPEFYEGEIGQRTEVFGRVAIRFSAYEAKFDYAATEPAARGLNSFQLIKVDDEWLVASLTWYDETADLKLPSTYL